MAQDHLTDLRDELVSRTYHPTTSICFVQRKPKLREIFAAYFRDRVVHHLLVGYLEPIFERRFIHDSFACRKNKGVHAGVTRLREFLNRVTANGSRRGWYLKEDISGFFMHIDKEILYQFVCRKIKREDVRWLARQVIFHDCSEDYHFKGKRSLLQRIPPHKTLFLTPPGKGLPIGNLSSQFFFANVYLNELDQFVKRELGCRYYLRYCDDFLLLSTSPEELASWREAIEAFLVEKLLLKLNGQQHRLRPVANGIDFLGYVVRRRYVLVRRRVVNHLRERLHGFDEELAERRRGQLTAWCYPPEVMAAMRALKKLPVCSADPMSGWAFRLRWLDLCRRQALDNTQLSFQGGRAFGKHNMCIPPQHDFTSTGRFGTSMSAHRIPGLEQVPRVRLFAD